MSNNAVALIWASRSSPWLSGGIKTRKIHYFGLAHRLYFGLRGLSFLTGPIGAFGGAGGLGAIGANGFAMPLKGFISRGGRSTPASGYCRLLELLCGAPGGLAGDCWRVGLGGRGALGGSSDLGAWGSFASAAILSARKIALCISCLLLKKQSPLSLFSQRKPASNLRT